MQTRRGRLTAVRGILPMAVLCASTIGCSGSEAGTADRFYATTGPDNKLVSIEISDGSKIRITPIGTTGARGCGSVALSTDGTLYSVCGPGLMGPGRQQLATIDPKTGHATLFGTEVYNLQVMGLEFAPDGTLYGVGDANRASPTFNSLYTVDLKTGEFTRIGSTGVPDPEFFMDFAFDSRGTCMAPRVTSSSPSISRRESPQRSSISWAAATSWGSPTTRSGTSCTRPISRRRTRLCMWSTLRRDSSLRWPPSDTRCPMASCL